MDTKISKYLKWNNWILTVLIVAMHSSCPYLVSNRKIDAFFQFINIWFSLAVPSFFTISMFLLMWNNANYKDCIQKIKRRFKSVFVPFFLFSSLSVMLMYAYFIFFGVEDYSFSNFFVDIWSSKYDPPIWFLKTLFELQIIACMLYMIIKDKVLVYFCVFIVSVVVNTLIDVSYSTPLFWFPSMIIGMVLAVLYRANKLSKLKISKQVVVLTTLFLLISTVSIFKYDIEAKSNLYYLYRVFGSLLLCTALFGLDLDKKIVPRISYYSFLIFLLHVPILSPIRKILWIVLKPLKEFGCMLTYMLTIILTIVTIVMIGHVTKKYMPRLWGIINGGR